MTVRREVQTELPPGELLRALARGRLPFMLTGEWGCGAMLGCEPVQVVRGDAAFDVQAAGIQGTQGPEKGAQGPGGGWWVGYLGYQLGAVVERLPPPPPRPVPLAGAQMSRYEWVLRCPGDDGKWFVEAVDAEALERGLRSCERALGGFDGCAPSGAGASAWSGVQARAWRLGPMRIRGAGGDGHRAAVAECTRRIAAGDLFQANICLRLEGELEGSPADAFADAVALLEPAHGAYIGTEDGAILSFSPELFLRRDGREVATAPIKGTAPRLPDGPGALRLPVAPGDARLSAMPGDAADATADAEAARAALAGSVKDAAEHVMIVDLMRNDLGRVCEYGSVRADPEPEVQPHPGVWHLVTAVRGRLRPGVSNGELLRASFPPGSVTGAPKVQAMKLIGELEGTGREVYTGAVGYMGPRDDELELNVAIRTLEVSGGHAWIGAGGGIVADSVPEAELAEALGKATPILAALRTTVRTTEAAGATREWGRRISRRPDPTAGVFETVLVQEQVAIDLERHLQRLAGSARQLYGVELPASLRADVERAVAGCEQRRARMRIRVGPDGAAEVTAVAAGGAAIGTTPIELTPVLVAGGLGPHKLADREPLTEYERSGHAALIYDCDGAVLEASFANVWALAGGRLLTPPADGRLLPGTIRARLLEAPEAVADEERLTLEDLRGADALLTSSSIRLVAPAALAGSQPTAAAFELAAGLSGRLG